MFLLFDLWVQKATTKNLMVLMNSYQTLVTPDAEILIDWDF